jgi:3-oxoacyl-[acyl-carrier-protein] synthase III
MEANSGMEGHVWLAGAAYELGEQRISYAQIDGLQVLFAAQRIPWLPELLGLGAIYKTVDVYRLASASIRKTLTKAGVPGSLVDCVIVSAASVRHDFNIQKVGFGRALLDNAISPHGFFGVYATGCVAVLSAIELARDLVLAQRFHHVLIVNVDHIGSDDDKARFLGYALVSDSAASVLVTDRPERQALHHRIVWISKQTDVDQMLKGIRWNNADIDIGISTISEMQQAGKIACSKLGKILANNTFLPIKKQRERALGFAPNQIFLDNTARIGHCLAADGLIGLVDCEASGTLEPTLQLLYSEADGHAAAVVVAG